MKLMLLIILSRWFCMTSISIFTIIFVRLRRIEFIWDTLIMQFTPAHSFDANRYIKMN